MSDDNDRLRIEYTGSIKGLTKIMGFISNQPHVGEPRPPSVPTWEYRVGKREPIISNYFRGSSVWPIFSGDDKIVCLCFDEQRAYGIVKALERFIEDEECEG